jgi:hypothetical protein
VRYVHLTLTEQEAKALEEAQTVIDVTDFRRQDVSAYRRARRKLREGRKQFEIEKQKRGN